MHSRFKQACFLAVWFCWLTSLAAQDLPQKTLDSITQKLVPAHRAGKRVVVWNVLHSIVDKLEDEQLAALDETLEDENLPTTAEIFADIRLASDASKLKLRRPKNQEASMVLDNANASIKEAMEQREWVSILDPDHETASSFEDFDRAIWDAHVYHNELENAATLAIAAGRFQKQNLAVLKKQPNFKARDFSQKVKDLYQIRIELHERDLNLKLDRIAFSIAKLNELKTKDAESVDVAHTRIWAGYSLKKDGETLLEVLKLAEERNAKEFEYLTELNMAKGRSKARKMINVGRKESKDLLEKSEHLFVGLHWWYRGRYGRGTHNMGLLKPPAAARNIKAQNALNMPKRPPRPTDPAMFVRKDVIGKPVAKRIAKATVGGSESIAKTDSNDKAKGDGTKVETLSASYSESKKASNDYVYGVAYDKQYTRSPDYDRRHHYIWSQKPPLFVTQNVGMYFH